MSDKTNYSQQANLESNLGISPSAVRYMALHSVTGSDGTAGTEIADASYTRQIIGWGPRLIATGVSGSVTTGNTASVAFPAFASQQTVAAWSIYDALSSGNRYYHKAISSATWPAGYSLTFPSGSVTIQEQ